MYNQSWKFGQKTSPAPPRPAEKKPAPPRASRKQKYLNIFFRRSTPEYPSLIITLENLRAGAGRVLKWPPPRPAGVGFLLPPLAAHTHADLHRSLLHLARKLQIEIGAIYVLVYPCMV